MKVLDNAKLSSVAGGGLFQLGPGNILMPIRFWFKTEEDWQRFLNLGNTIKRKAAFLKRASCVACIFANRVRGSPHIYLRAAQTLKSTCSVCGTHAVFDLTETICTAFPNNKSP